MWYNYTSANLIKATAAMFAASRGHDTRKGKFLMQPHSTLSAPVVKTCNKCGEAKPATTEYFNLHRKAKDGLQWQCKACDRAYRKANRGRLNEQKRAYHQANKEHANRKSREWHAANRDFAIERSRAYYQANKERYAEYGRAYYAANKEYILERTRAYKSRNKRRIAEWGSAYRIANKEIRRVNHRRRRAVKRNAEGSHTVEDIQQQYKAQKGRCYYCHEFVGNDYHVDHVIPLVRGGSNGPENIVIACPTCNMAKHDKLPHEWPQGGRLL